MKLVNILHNSCKMAVGGRQWRRARHKQIISSGLRLAFKASYTICCQAGILHGPFKLIDLLDEDAFTRESAMAELLSARDCLLDPFTKDFRVAYPTADALTSPQCLGELRIVLSSTVMYNI